MTEHSSSAHGKHAYVSNPFLNGVRGLIGVLQHNPVSAMLIALIIIAGIVAVAILSGVMVAAMFDDGGAGVVGAVLFLVAYVAVLTYGGGAYLSVAAHSSRGQTISTSQAFAEANKRFLPYFGLLLLTILGAVVGFALLVIPGIIFVARSSLAGLAMFEEDLNPIDALKRSFDLTNGHTFEMIGALFGGALLGAYGLLGPAIAVAPLVGRYQDLKALKASGGQKPEVHWLNYLVTALVVFFALLYAFSIVTAFRTADRVENEINNSTNEVNRSLEEYREKYEQDLRDAEEEYDSQYNSDYDYDYNYE